MLHIKAKREKIVAKSEHTYTKQYLSLASLMKEWTVATECQSYCIQKIVNVHLDELKIDFEYNQHAVSLAQFTPEQLPVFCYIVADIIAAIKHYHQCGWVHGDIKPANILYLPKFKSIRIIDFGASQRKGTDRRNLKQWQLTRMFASANQLKGLGYVNAADDWYALRIMLTQLATIKLEKEFVGLINSYKHQTETLMLRNLPD
ncbi:MAG: protein kinase domain-containing protein [Parashewanella sp.]